MQKTTDVLPVIRQQATRLENEIVGLVIKTEEDLKLASDRTKQVKLLKARIKEEQEKFTEPAKEIIAQARAKYGPFLAQCERWEETLKQKAGDFLIEQQAKIKEQEVKIVERVERGTMKEETAVRKLEQLPEQRTSVETGKSGLQMRTLKELEIYDVNQIPREYMIPLTANIKQALLAGVDVPGARLTERQIVASI